MINVFEVNLGKIMILQAIDLIFQIYMLMLFARILSSWLPELQQTKVMQFISFYTDPYLNIFRSIIPPLGMLDISPIFAFICLSLMEQVVKGVAIYLIR